MTEMKRLALLLLVAAAANAAEPKNLKVLKGIPQADLIPVMTVMANSLGVTCAYCHEAAWDSDAKPAKEAGRRMIVLLRSINDTHYGGKTVVTCNTCHRGRVATVDIPLIADAGYNRVAESNVVKPALPPAAELLAPFRPPASARGIVTAVSGRADPRSGPFELIDRAFTTQVPYPPEAKYAFRPLMFEKGTTVGTERIRNRDAWVVELAPGQRIYRDAASGVLLRWTREVPTIVGPLPEQYDFDDYRTVDGALVPFLLQWSRGDYQVTHRVVEIPKPE
jgi:hypothetical protein